MQKSRLDIDRSIRSSLIVPNREESISEKRREVRSFSMNAVSKVIPIPVSAPTDEYAVLALNWRAIVFFLEVASDDDDDYVAVAVSV